MVSCQTEIVASLNTGGGNIFSIFLFPTLSNNPWHRENPCYQINKFMSKYTLFVLCCVLMLDVETITTVNSDFLKQNLKRSTSAWKKIFRNFFVQLAICSLCQQIFTGNLQHAEYCKARSLLSRTKRCSGETSSLSKAVTLLRVTVKYTLFVLSTFPNHLRQDGIQISSILQSPQGPNAGYTSGKQNYLVDRQTDLTAVKEYVFLALERWFSLYQKILLDKCSSAL